MQDRNKNRFSLPVVAAITGIILAAGGGAAWWAKSALEPARVRPKPNPIVRDQVPNIPEPITQEKIVQICWLNPTDESIELVSKTMTFQKSVKGDRVLETAFETLLAQPPEGSPYTTAIPQGTKLLDLKVNKKGIHLNLSQEFIAGGGSASMSSRLAQVVYTATSSNNGDRVWINVEGKPLANLGEEGIVVNQPMTRQDFQDNFTL
ncbi:GerMN domain-containing protein [Pleurocapsales cyanobacterium LEGE 10410]|nr:GerMN domain-containing protein [Pleurocapsales cyanobacterium LEGE 10410]